MEDIFIDSIPGALAGGIVGFITLGAFKFFNNASSSNGRENINGTTNNSNNVKIINAYDLLAFKPILFTFDKSQKFTRLFITLQNFRNFAPTIFDQAGRLTDKFLSQYKLLSDVEYETFDCNNHNNLLNLKLDMYMNTTIKLWADIYNKLDQYQQTVIKQMEEIQVENNSIKMTQDTLNQTIIAIDQHLNSYTTATEQKVNKLYKRQEHFQTCYQRQQMEHQQAQNQQMDHEQLKHQQLQNVSTMSDNQSPTTSQQLQEQAQEQKTQPQTGLKSMLSSILPPDFTTNQINGTLVDVGKSLLHHFTQS